MSLEAAIEDVQRAAEFLRGNVFRAELERAIQRAAIQAQSPWVDRQGGAAHACCSVSEFDRAVAAGVIARHVRGGTPMFRKADIDAAIENGTWPKRSHEGAKADRQN